MQYEKAMPLGRPLPKFGDWDVNDPASAEGYTVIFNKARDDRRSGARTPLILAAPDKYDARKKEDKYKYPKKVCMPNYRF